MHLPGSSEYLMRLDEEQRMKEWVGFVDNDFILNSGKIVPEKL